MPKATTKKVKAEKETWSTAESRKAGKVVKKTKTVSKTTKKKAPAKTVSTKEDKSSVLKSEELIGWWFLSWLGFKKEEAKSKPEEETSVTTSDIFDKSSETIVDRPRYRTIVSCGKERGGMI